MELKPGYKLTEVGVIPEDWDVRPCSELSERIMVGIVIRPAQYYVPQGVPAFRSANIRESGINDSDLVFISETANALLVKSQTRTGDILTVRTGYPGTSAVVRPAHTGCNCIDVLITRPSKKIDSDYLAIWINSSFGKEQVLRNQGGLAQQHFNVGDMRELLVAVPSLPEQQLIATALSDMDELLGACDRLIAKKRDLKQAAMQQLLTGKTRLPGFDGGKGYKETEVGLIPEDWDVKAVSDIGSVKGGKRLPKGRDLIDTLTPYPYIRVADMRWGYVDMSDIKYVPEEVAAIIKNYRIKSTDIFISVAGTLGIIGIIPEELDGANLTENADRITDINCHRDFLLYSLMTERIQNEIDSQRTVGAQPKLAINRIEGFRVAIPKDEEEQRSIATILSDMDAEIAALEHRRDKTRALKQAMMQELLTGKTRLI